MRAQIVQLVEHQTFNLTVQGSRVQILVQVEDYLGFPAGSDGKESTCNVGDLGSIPGLGRSPGGGHGILLQYSCLDGESPWTKEPGRLQSTGSQRVGHD